MVITRHFVVEVVAAVAVAAAAAVVVVVVVCRSQGGLQEMPIFSQAQRLRTSLAEAEAKIAGLQVPIRVTGPDGARGFV